jgi:hypothetical protein
VSFSMFRPTGPFLTDPRQWPRYSIAQSSIIRSYSATTATANISTFWTGAVGSVDRIPGTQIFNTSVGSNTYGTIATVASGSGLISNIISGVSNGAAVITFRITIDGVQHTIACDTVVDGGNGAPAILGPALPIDAYHAGSQYGYQHDATSTDGFTASVATAASLILLGPQDPRMWPMLLRFERSLLVEYKCSTGNSASGNVLPNRAGVLMYRTS